MHEGIARQITKQRSRKETIVSLLVVEVIWKAASAIEGPLEYRRPDRLPVETNWRMGPQVIPEDDGEMVEEGDSVEVRVEVEVVDNVVRVLVVIEEQSENSTKHEHKYNMKGRDQNKKSIPVSQVSVVDVAVVGAPT